MRAGGITNLNIEISPFEIKRKLEIAEKRPYVQKSQKPFNGQPSANQATQLPGKDGQNTRLPSTHQAALYSYARALLDAHFDGYRSG
jgi:hypothetical protein